MCSSSRRRATDRDEILDVIEQLQPGGSTNLEAGLRLGYELARESLTENGIDRVVLASDGVANVGLTDPEWHPRQRSGATRRPASSSSRSASGWATTTTSLLEQLADQGDGFYAYVNGPDEARRLFTEDLTGTLQTVALDAQAQVEFDPDVVAAYRLVGYENRDIADRDFTERQRRRGRDRRRPQRDRAVRRATARGRRPPGRASRPSGCAGPIRTTAGVDEVAREIRTSDLARSFQATDPYFRFDAIVAATAEVLRGSPWAGRLDLGDVADVAYHEARGPPADRRGPRLPRPARPPGPYGRVGLSPNPSAGRGRRRPRPAVTTRSGRLAGLRVVTCLGHGRGELADRALHRLTKVDRAVARPPLEDAPHRAVIGARELDDERAHLRMLGPCGVGHVGRPQDGLAGRDPRALLADTDPAAALDDDEPVVFGLACGSMRAPRAKASSVTAPRPSQWIGWPVTPTVPGGPSGRR